MIECGMCVWEETCTLHKTGVTACTDGIEVRKEEREDDHHSVVGVFLGVVPDDPG